MKKRLALQALILLALIGCSQQPQIQADFGTRPFKACSTVYASYPAPESELTPPPAGYEPFCISHYGRHGSRRVIGNNYYSKVGDILRAGKDAGVLSAKGEDLLIRIDEMDLEHRDRSGGLTILGHEQHRGIAERMFRNFSEVFKGNTTIQARSSTVIRCILSMQEATARLGQLNTNLNIVTDASAADMVYITSSNDNGVWLDEITAKCEAVREKFQSENLDASRLLGDLFTDKEWAAANIDGPEFMNDMFNFQAGQQCLEYESDVTFDDILNEEELKACSRMHTLWWYTLHCESYAPFRQRSLLKNFLSTADTCMSSPRKNVVLRYGHDSCLLPLCALLETNDAAQQYDSYDQMLECWNETDYIPMAGNIQLIFYRSRTAGAPILVKALLNEKEAKLPAETDIFPYYEWDGLASYYKAKIKNFELNILPELNL